MNIPPSGSSSSIILLISSNSCCLFADIIAADLDKDGIATVLISGSSAVNGSAFRALAGFFGGAFANADMMLPDAVRFIVVLDVLVDSDVLLLDTYGRDLTSSSPVQFFRSPLGSVQ